MVHPFGVFDNSQEELKRTLISAGANVISKTIPNGQHNLHFKYADQFAQWVMDFIE